MAQLATSSCVVHCTWLWESAAVTRQMQSCSEADNHRLLAIVESFATKALWRANRIYTVKGKQTLELSLLTE